MLKLTDQEKQEVIRHLESDRELPDKYRFLLFEGKRETERLVQSYRNLKTQQSCSLIPACYSRGDGTEVYFINITEIK